MLDSQNGNTMALFAVMRARSSNQYNNYHTFCNTAECAPRRWSQIDHCINKTGQEM